MANFCGKCGTPLGAGPFCAKCGTDTRSVMESAQSQSPRQPAASPQTTSGPGAATGKQGMSTLAKLGIAAVGIVFVGGVAGAAGLYYVAHRVSQKVHQAEKQILGSTSNTGDKSAPDESLPDGGSAGSSSDNSMGNVCRFLDKEDVSTAIGVAIVKSQADGESCSYFAKGKGSDMAAKHAASMLGAKGADDRTKALAEQFGKAIMGMSGEKKDDGGDGQGNVPVFSFSVSDSASAVAEMKLNAKVMKNLGGKTGEDLDIGDQAFASSDSMIMVRKGGKIIRITYMTCPCSTKEILPLARKLADSL